MVNFTNGYYFFTPQTSKNAESFGGFSLYFSRRSINISFFQDTLSFARGLGGGCAVRATFDVDGKSTKRFEYPFRQELSLQYPQGFKRLIMIELCRSGVAVASVGNIVQSESEGAEAKPAVSEPLPFDPFETTNPSYSWRVCTLKTSFDFVLKNSGITLPSSIDGNAEAAAIRFGHLLLGKYLGEGGRRFIIVGIPTGSPEESCSYNKKYDAARYVAASKHYGKADYAGYHLYYIDEKTAALVKVVVKD